jgi:hypothetical protein
MSHEFDVRARADSGGAQGVERGEHGDDGRFVVARSAGVEPRFGVEGLAVGGQRNHLAAVLHGFVTQDWFEWRAGPLLGVERLAIVVRVEDDGAGGAGSGQVAEDHGVGAGDAHQFGLHAALFEHARDGLGVALDVVAVAGDVGDGEQGEEFVDDGAFVLLPPLAGGARGGVILRGGGGGGQ